MKMTANRRIWLNVVATYARNVYSLALGLVTARWLLLSLGQADYGLFGVVGALIAFVTFFNQLLSGAMARFYAIAIGQSAREGGRGAGLRECRRWFTAAVSVHTVVPLLLVAVGFPLGRFAVDNWLVIPPERLAACHWVWCFSCLSAFVAMANVPFRAMFTAKQEIAEVTVYAVAESTLNAVLLYYMVCHPGDWLSRYALWHCLLAILPRLVICARALSAFPECRILKGSLFCWRDIRHVATFAGWNALGLLGKVVREKGMMVLVNVTFGAVQNAAVAVATRLADRANAFSQSLVTAFTPAIVTAYGAGKRERMLGLARRVSKFGGMLVIFVSLPLLLEVQEVMRIWLRDPPPESPFLCACVLVAVLFNKITAGEHAAISASGRMAAYQIAAGAIDVLAIPAAWLLMGAGTGLASVGYAVLGAMALNVVVRVGFAQMQADVPALDWIRRTALPLLALALVGLAAAAIPRFAVQQASFLRIVLTTVSAEAVMLPFAWFAVVDAGEREYLREKLTKVRIYLFEEGKGACS